MGCVGTIFTILISVLVIILLAWVVFYPEPIKYVLTALYPGQDYAPNENAKRIANTTLYSSPNSSHDKLVVVFIGGSGLYSRMDNFYGFSNKLNEMLGDEYDILLFEYPVRFKNTILDSMIAINKVLVDYIHYKTVHAIGISFGALLAGAFYQKEATLTKSIAMKVPQIGIKFTTLSVLSGVFECKFNADLMTKLFNFYIMRGTPSTINYTCYGIPIPKLAISANTDFLVAQTVKFIQHEQCESKIYKSQSLPHAFCQHINLDEAIDSIKLVSNFIVKNTT